MRKKSRPKQEGFDARFDDGEAIVDFSMGVLTKGLSKTTQFPPMELPGWLAAEIERLATFHANTKTAVVRQLLVEAIQARQHV